jgi:hypothetical protein
VSLMSSPTTILDLTDQFQNCGASLVQGCVPRLSTQSAHLPLSPLSMGAVKSSAAESALHTPTEQHDGSVGLGRSSSSKDPVTVVSSWIDDNLQVVRGALSVVVVGSAVASALLLRRAVREAREALTLATNRDVVKLIESMRSTTPVTLTMRVESVTESGHIRVTHNPWWRRSVRSSLCMPRSWAQQTGVWSVAVVARPLAHTPHPLLRENNHTMALSAKCNSCLQAATCASLTRGCIIFQRRDTQCNVSFGRLRIPSSHVTTAVFTIHSIVTRAHCGVHNAFHRRTWPLRCSQCIPSSHVPTAVFTMHSIVTRDHCGVHNAFHRHT